MKVRFYGILREKFGGEFDLPGMKTARQAMEHLNSLVPGLRQFFMDNSDRPFHVLYDSESIGEEELTTPCGGRTVRVMAAVEGGGGGGGLLKAILGVALAVVDTFFLHTGILTKIGIAMAMGGVAQMMAPAPPKIGGDKGNDPGHNFNGTDNITAQDQTIPVLYGGPLLCGSLVVSLGTSADTNFPSGKGGGPFGKQINDAADLSEWEQMSDLGGISAWFNGGNGISRPFVWNIDPK